MYAFSWDYKKLTPSPSHPIALSYYLEPLIKRNVEKHRKYENMAVSLIFQ